VRSSQISARSVSFWLQVILGLFLVTLGILGLRGEYTLLSRSRALFRDDRLRSIAAIIELAGGAVLLLALFVPLNRRFMFIAAVVVFANWLLLILDTLFFRGFFEPDFLTWLNSFTWYLIPAAVMWLVANRYR
jgi:hypothetical protein